MDILEFAKTKQNSEIITMLEKAKPTLEYVKATLACDDASMVRLLDEYKEAIDVNTQDCHHKTEYSLDVLPLPLLIAVANQLQDMDIVRVLEQAKADVNFYHKSMFPRGPIYFMLETLYPKTPEDIVIRVMEEADLSLKNSHGKTYLYEVNSDVRSTDFINQILLKGVDIAERCIVGNTILDHSILRNESEGVKFYKEQVMAIIMGDDWEKRRDFITKGLDMMLECTDENETPIREVAKQKNDTRTIEFLKELEKIKKFHIDLFFTIVEGTESTTVDIEHVFEQCPDKVQLMNIRDKGGRTALHMACLVNKVFLVEYLMNNFKDTLNCRDNMRRTALHYVAALDNEILYTTLVNAGADETLKDVNNLTPKDYMGLNQQPVKPEDEREPEEFIVQEMIQKEREKRYGDMFYFQFHYNKFSKAIAEKNLKAVQVQMWKFSKNINEMPMFVSEEPLLFLCLKHNAIDIAKFLIDKSLDCYVTWEGKTFRDAARESAIQELIACIEEAIRIKTLQAAVQNDRRSSASSYGSLPYAATPNAPHALYEPPVYKPRPRKEFSVEPKNIDSRYLADQLGEALQLALAEVADKRPWDPIEYLAQWLYKHAENLKNDEEERKEKYNLEVEKYDAHREKRRSKRQAKEVESIKLADAEQMKKKRQEEEKKRREKEEEEKRMAELEEIQKKNRENVEQYAQKPDLESVIEEDEPNASKTLAPPKILKEETEKEDEKEDDPPDAENAGEDTQGK
ncbi:unnamed protein product [Owenia fusiformis]|uniref:Uncharacterized protein n=1 Tax=Owenia fusiformis TaxID=6347 RepID=A0A8J1XPW4_OWEFU|nr:unnamed protein product [Owenia fusiformis]